MSSTTLLKSSHFMQHTSLIRVLLRPHYVHLRVVTFPTTEFWLDVGANVLFRPHSSKHSPLPNNSSPASRKARPPRDSAPVSSTLLCEPTQRSHHVPIHQSSCGSGGIHPELSGHPSRYLTRRRIALERSFAARGYARCPTGRSSKSHASRQKLRHDG